MEDAVQKAGHRLGGGVGVCSSGIVWGKQIGGFEVLSASRHTLLEYPGSKEKKRYIVRTFSNNTRTYEYNYRCGGTIKMLATARDVTNPTT